MRCLHCELPLMIIDGGDPVVDGTDTTADGLSFCPPDPDHEPTGTHLPVCCPRHGAEVRAWRGQGCGESGWGPGHRIPHGVTMALVDETVASIRSSCRARVGCSDDVVPGLTRCQSRDRCE